MYKMHTSIAAVILTSLLALASAQQTYTIDPDSVSDSTRDYWCTQQQTQCPLICLQTTTGVPEQNNCTASSLTFACVCSDGNSPNLTQYSQTLPFFICETWGTQCVSNCGGDSSCGADCRSQHPCGAQSPVPPNSTTASATGSATASPTSSGDAVHTGFAGQDSGDGGDSGNSDGNGNSDNGANGPMFAGWAVLLTGLTLAFTVAL